MNVNNWWTLNLAVTHEITALCPNTCLFKVKKASSRLVIIWSCSGLLLFSESLNQHGKPTEIQLYLVFKTHKQCVSTLISVFLFAPLSLVVVQGKWQQASLREWVTKEVMSSVLGTETVRKSNGALGYVKAQSGQRTHFTPLLWRTKVALGGICFSALCVVYSNVCVCVCVCVCIHVWRGFMAYIWVLHCLEGGALKTQYNPYHSI